VSNVKLERLNSSIQREVSIILKNDVRDKQIKFVTVTAVKTAGDMSSAKIYVTVLDQTKKEEIMSSLQNAKGFVRSSLASKLNMRHVPDLEFVYDESIEYGMNIEQKLKEIHE